MEGMLELSSEGGGGGRRGLGCWCDNGKCSGWLCCRSAPWVRSGCQLVVSPRDVRAPGAWWRYGWRWDLGRKGLCLACLCVLPSDPVVVSEQKQPCWEGPGWAGGAG